MVQVNERWHNEAGENQYPAEQLRGALVELCGERDSRECSNGRMGGIVGQGLQQWMLGQLHKVVPQQTRNGHQGC